MTTLERIRAEICEERSKHNMSCSDCLDIIDKYNPKEEEWYRAIVEAFEPCEDAISRNDMLDAVGHGTTYTSLELQKIINGLPSVNPVPCDDVVSRQAVLDLFEHYCGTAKICNYNQIFDDVKQLPSVRPQEQAVLDNLCNSCTNIGCEFQSGIVRTKCAFYMPPHIEPDNCGNYVVMTPVRPQEQTGHWIIDKGSLDAFYGEVCKCSECGVENIGESDYCPSCGCRMFEPQESEE